jgi:hypothetical protein
MKAEIKTEGKAESDMKSESKDFFYQPFQLQLA